MTRIVLTAALVAALSEPLAAQGRGRDADGVPPGHRPPAGMCRIWIDGVPPGRQPAPVSCESAVRNRPANGRVIYGDDTRYAYDDRYGKNKSNKGKWKHSGRDDRDRDRNDGWYDDDDDRYDRKGGRRADRDDYCLDRDHDGRCDFGASTSRTGRTLPRMIRTVIIDRRLGSAEQQRWLGSRDVRGRYVDSDRNGIPERITWLDGLGRVVQEWVDGNRDGRADFVRSVAAR